MQKFFIDTNIIIDLLANREPHSKYATILFDSAEKGDVKLYTSSHSVATSYYLLKKLIDDKELRVILFEITHFLEPLAVDLMIIKKALKSKVKDFEDAIQITTALTITDMNAIVTRNIKDFKDSEIKAITPDEAITFIK